MVVPGAPNGEIQRTERSEFVGRELTGVGPAVGVILPEHGPVGLQIPGGRHDRSEIASPRAPETPTFLSLTRREREIPAAACSLYSARAPPVVPEPSAARDSISLRSPFTHATCAPTSPRATRIFDSFARSDVTIAIAREDSRASAERNGSSVMRARASKSFARVGIIARSRHPPLRPPARVLRFELEERDATSAGARFAIYLATTTAERCFRRTHGARRHSRDSTFAPRVRNLAAGRFARSAAVAREP